MTDFIIIIIIIIAYTALARNALRDKNAYAVARHLADVTAESLKRIGWEITGFHTGAAKLAYVASAWGNDGEHLGIRIEMGITRIRKHCCLSLWLMYSDTMNV